MSSFQQSEPLVLRDVLSSEPSKVIAAPRNSNGSDTRSYLEDQQKARLESREEKLNEGELQKNTKKAVLGWKEEKEVYNKTKSTVPATEVDDEKGMIGEAIADVRVTKVNRKLEEQRAEFLADGFLNRLRTFRQYSDDGNYYKMTLILY
ncbi:hypothetical protein DSL72_005988 [Monilinia vaccinii-corymbosi]|uniref:Uncharacterized protein n=1 Tax=Monilinia vaccinii-corymbosi TaxID=61207 RepID=A0A8A3PHD6_9HELO|nr:hypothetical protein DSL72_005988 [Monilinia vaccinii-corymbosi]